MDTFGNLNINLRGHSTLAKKSMTRLIKFRAWNKYNGMMDVMELGFHHSPNVLCKWDYDKGTHQEAKFTNSEQATKDGGKKACIVMQFTGLLDKNGKEIYEGDIVEWKPPGDFYRNNVSTGEIVFSEDCFVVQAIKLGSFQPEEEGNVYSNDFYGPEGREFSWGDCEVIGNIYENPELLN